MGVYIHNIEDEHGKTGVKGQDPLQCWSYNKEIKTYDWINDKGYDNFGHWIEAAYQQACTVGKRIAQSVKRNILYPISK